MSRGAFKGTYSKSACHDALDLIVYSPSLSSSLKFRHFSAVRPSLIVSISMPSPSSLPSSSMRSEISDWISGADRTLARQSRNESGTFYNKVKLPSTSGGPWCMVHTEHKMVDDKPEVSVGLAWNGLVAEGKGFDPETLEEAVRKTLRECETLDDYSPVLVGEPEERELHEVSRKTRHIVYKYLSSTRREFGVNVHEADRFTEEVWGAHKQSDGSASRKEISDVLLGWRPRQVIEADTASTTIEPVRSSST